MSKKITLTAAQKVLWTAWAHAETPAQWEETKRQMRENKTYPSRLIG